MRKITVTSAQIIAMREATMRDNGSYELTTAKGQTINALVRAGIVVDGTRFLTVQGVSVYHSVCHVDVIASKGFRTSVSDDVEGLALFTLPETVTDAENGTETLTGGTVEIQGVDPSEWTPDMSALTGECYFGCGRPVTGMFVDYVGKTEGVCDLDRNKLDASTLVTPVDPSVWGGKGDDVATVAVIQNRAGMNGRTHYHAPGCRDIAREMKHWGQRQDDVMEASFSSVAEILAFEYGDIASDSAESDTPEWWAEILHNATIDADMVNGFGVKIMPCLDIPQGRAGNGPLVSKGGFYRIGFDQPTAERVAEIRAEIDAHDCNEADCITCIVRDMNREEIPSVEEFPNERAYKSGTENARDHARDNGFTEYGEEWQTVFRSSYALSLEIQAEENANDAGFVETMVTHDYELSVIVDETTGATVYLGWVTLEMNAAQYMDFDRVAEAYGKAHGTGTPRHGWASIIECHTVA